MTIELQNASKTLFQWFSDNQMKSNPDKCSFFCSTSKKVSLIVENKDINNSMHDRLLGVKIDSKSFFNTHIDDICKKASLKFNPLSRITPLLDFIDKFFFLSQFNYCQLIWMCHSRIKNNKINGFMKDAYVWALSLFTIVVEGFLPPKCIRHIIVCPQKL